MTWVVRIFDDHLNFPHTAHAVDVLEGRKRFFNNVLGCLRYSLKCFVVCSSTVTKPNNNRARKDALFSPCVE